MVLGLRRPSGVVSSFSTPERFRVSGAFLALLARVVMMMGGGTAGLKNGTELSVEKIGEVVSTSARVVAAG